jgi:hypothetical protein
VDLIGSLRVFADDAGHALAGWRDHGRRDVRLRVAANCHDRASAERLGREVTALYTCGPAGGGGVRTGLRPRLDILSLALPRERVQTRWQFLGDAR